MRKHVVAKWDDLQDRTPISAVIENVDIVVTRFDDDVAVFYGRCLHRGALLGDGYVGGQNLMCGVHGWDYRLTTGVSEYNNEERLPKFWSAIESGNVVVDADEISEWERKNPQPYNRDAYLGAYADIHGTPDEPHNCLIRQLATGGLAGGEHGPVDAMGVSRSLLPSWDDLQFVTAQLARSPQLDGTPVGTELVIGPKTKKPLKLDMPIIVSDMSFGALSEEAKISLAKGAELAGTGICSGEGGMLPEEQEANSRYFYELASARFGFTMDKLAGVQAFHFKGGQGVKREQGGIFRARRYRAKSPRSEAWKKASPRFHPLDSPTGTLLNKLGLSPMRSESSQAEFQSDTSCPPNTSKTISTQPLKSASTT